LWLNLILFFFVLFVFFVDKFLIFLRTNMPISTLILAGGRGLRIGGGKALQHLHGRPLLAWVLDAVRLQSDEVLLNANEQLADYAQFAYPVVSDLCPDYAGPLAGLQAGMRLAKHPLIACVPCDTPFLPNDLLAKLSAAIGPHDAVVACVNGQRQPTIALYQRRVLPKLDAYLHSGGRKVGDWLDQLDTCAVAFKSANNFYNINTPQELQHAPKP
jgi:molybdenum cofactor guanylyltransferase